jgi:copper resistance protein C
MHVSRRTHVRLLVAGLLSAGCTMLGAVPAQAHDKLISTNPPDKAQVAVVPAQLVLTFEEPPVKTGSQVIVKGPGGNAQSGAPVFSGNTVTQAVAPGSPAGAYTVTWRVTSDDGHAVFGTFAFTAAAASTSSATTSGSVAPSQASKPTASKGLWLLMLLVLLVPIGLFVRRGAARAREMSER